MVQARSFGKGWIAIAWLLAVVGCDDDTKTSGSKSTGPLPPLSSKPLAEARGAEGPLFRRLGEAELGFSFTNELKKENVKRYLENGSGLAIGDFDGDGKPDLYLVSLDGHNKLLRQTDRLRFEDVTAKAGVDGGDAWGSGASFVDVDGDGDLDLYVCNLGSANLLYVNQGDGTFVESAEKAGLAFAGASNLASFADYDRDGDLDAYLLTNRVFGVAESVDGEAKIGRKGGKIVVPDEYKEEIMIVEGRPTQAGQADHLYRNDGDGTFTDVSAEAGIAGYDMGLSVTWWDFDDDGWLDIYVGNDMKTPDHLYRNEGNGKFRDVLPSRVARTPWFSMGADTADVNNDGLMDLLVADMAATTHFKEKATMGDMGRDAWFLTAGHPRQFMRNALYVNTATSRLMEASYLAGISKTDWTWSVRFGDLDNDGLSDLFVTNGMARAVNDSDLNRQIAALQKEGKTKEAEALAQTYPPQEEPNMAFKNRGDLTFEDVSVRWGLDLVGVSHGASLADLDRDGDLDIVVSNLNAPVAVYENQGTGGRRIGVELRSEGKNRFGIGAELFGLATQLARQVERLGAVEVLVEAAQELDALVLGDPHERRDRLLQCGDAELGRPLGARHPRIEGGEHGDGRRLLVGVEDGRGLHHHVRRAMQVRGGGRGQAHRRARAHAADDGADLHAESFSRTMTRASRRRRGARTLARHTISTAGGFSSLVSSRSRITVSRCGAKIARSRPLTSKAISRCTTGSANSTPPPPGSRLYSLTVSPLFRSLSVERSGVAQRWWRSSRSIGGSGARVCCQISS